MADTYFTEETFDLLLKLENEKNQNERNRIYNKNVDIYRDKIRGPFQDLIGEVYDSLPEEIKTRVADPHDDKRRYFGGGWGQVEGFKGTNASDHYYAKLCSDIESSGARMVIVLSSAGIKIAFQPIKKSAQDRIADKGPLELKREFENREFEYRISGRNKDDIQSLRDWLKEQKTHSSQEGSSFTEIAHIFSKNQIVDGLTGKELVSHVADAIEALFPIYELAVDMDSADTNAANYARVAIDKDKHPNVLQIKELLEKERQVILTGPPGTSKTYTAFQVVSALQSGGSHVLEGERPYEGLIDCQFGQANEDQNVVWDIVQFHQSYGYEDFVSGIEAISDGDQEGLKLDRVDKVFLSMCDQAKDDLDANDGDVDKAPKYVLIIDEINRGILGRIFGELILGLEYRGLPIRLQGRNGENGEDNKKKDTITIPDNLYLIGTMNTADRNIALVDHALRRRFRFVDMPPNPDLLEEVLESKIESSQDRTTISTVFKRVQKLFEDKDSERAGAIDKKNYAVGHTYFMCDSMGDFWGNMHYQVLPLLEEYVREGVLQPDAMKALKQGEKVEETKEKIEKWLKLNKEGGDGDSGAGLMETNGAEGTSPQEKANQKNGVPQ